MASHQRRTEDLLRLKTRGLVYQNVDGSYPAEGTVPFVADTSGTISFTTGPASVTIDASGNMTVPGDLTVDGMTNINISVQNLDLLGVCPTISSTSSVSLIPANGFVGIGKCAPTAALDVSGGVSVSGTMTVVKDASFNSNIYVQGDSNVQKLDVSGTMTVVKDASFNSNIYVHGDGLATGSATIDYIDFPNYSATKPNGPTDLTQVSSLYSYLNRLTWEDTSGSTHDVMGWGYAPPATSANTFDLIDISGISGTDAISLCLIQTANTTNKLLTLLNNANAFLNVNSIVPPQPSTAIITDISLNGYDISFSYVISGSVGSIVSYYYKIYLNNKPISLPVILGPPVSGTYSVFVPDTTAYYPLNGPPPYLGSLSLSVSIVYTDVTGNNKEGPLSPPYLTNIINIDNNTLNYYNYIGYPSSQYYSSGYINTPFSTWIRCTTPSETNYLGIVKYSPQFPYQNPGIVLRILGSNAAPTSHLFVFYFLDATFTICGVAMNSNSVTLTSFVSPGIPWTFTQP